MEKDKKDISRRNFLELVAVGAAGAAVSGLGLPSDLSAAAKAAAPKAVMPKKGGTLKTGVGWLIQRPDPLRYQGGWARIHTSYIYEGLTTPVSQNELNQMLKKKGGAALRDVKPMLASGWEVDKKGTRYAFHLRKGVKFHNGKELDSKDVEWVWKRIQNPDNRCGARKLLTLYLKSIETPDKYTIVANLTQPYGAFPMANSFLFTQIMPKDSIPDGKLWGETYEPPIPGPHGTGPFKLVSFQQKAEAVLEAHREYRIQDCLTWTKLSSKSSASPGPRPWPSGPGISTSPARLTWSGFPRS